MLLNTILSTLAPHECLGCGREGSLLCTNCVSGLITLPERCYRCHVLSPSGKTCAACRRQTALFAVHAGTAYQGTAKELVWHLKFQGAQAAAEDMATLLARRFTFDKDTLFVPVPTATSRVRQRGYDQAQLLARELGRTMGVPYLSCLRRLGQHHQVGSGRQARLTQLRHAYRCIRPELVRNVHVVLVDDVLTSGATLEAAAKVIKAGGAKRVSALVFAQA